MLTWKSLLARTVAVTGVASAVLSLGVFVGVRLAQADPNGPPTRPELTFAGVLRDTTGNPHAGGTVTLTFAFHKGTATATPVCSPAVMATVAAGGAFSVPVPLAGCPRGLFDGTDVFYDVTLAGESTPLAQGVPVTPVPYARFADQVGVSSDCPAGYALDGTAGAVTVCVRTFAGGRDEVVKVGEGASAFWVDRYEASVFSADGARQFGVGAPDDAYPNLAKNGTWVGTARHSLRAVSRPGVTPSCNMTWFQAAALCRASGKELIDRGEWFASADGLVTLDPTTAINGNAAGETGCNTGGSGPRLTGGGTGCASSWGAQDLIGNLWEWTDEWYASVGQADATTTAFARVNGRRINDALTNDANGGWPSDYGGDATWNIASVVARTPSEDNKIGIPSAALRGGRRGDGPRAGAFALDLPYGPSFWDGNVGFRCVLRR